MYNWVIEREMQLDMPCYVDIDRQNLGQMNRSLFRSTVNRIDENLLYITTDLRSRTPTVHRIRIPSSLDPLPPLRYDDPPEVLRLVADHPQLRQLLADLLAFFARATQYARDQIGGPQAVVVGRDRIGDPRGVGVGVDDAYRRHRSQAAFVQKDPVLQRVQDDDQVWFKCGAVF